jgi:hypothetical protein
MAWDFEHTVAVNAPPAVAWAFWTSVDNWTLDPAVERRGDSDDQAGTPGPRLPPNSRGPGTLGV